MVKHLITGGCSFSFGGHETGWTGAVTKFLQKSNPNLTYEHTGYLSQGQDLIQKKVTIAVLDALEKGIKPEEILVLVMWSGTSRKAWYIDNSIIIEKMVKGWKKFQGGMSSQFLDLKNQNKNFNQSNFFYTQNNSRFDYDSNGGWYFTVDGSDCKLDFVQDYYLIDRNAHGVGKVHSSLENIIMLQTFLKLQKVNFLYQVFMDRVYQDIENYKEHELIKYLYCQLDQEFFIKEGMFEHLHTYLPYPKESAVFMPHHDRIKLDAGRGYFYNDGFHPGEKGAEMYCNDLLFPMLDKKGYI